MRRRRVRLRRGGSLVDGRSDRERLRGERRQFAEVELVRAGEAAVEEGGRVRLRRRRRLRRLGRAVGRRAAPGVGAVAVVGVGEPQEGVGEAFVVGVLLRRTHSFLDAL